MSCLKTAGICAITGAHLHLDSFQDSALRRFGGALYFSTGAIALRSFARCLSGPELVARFFAAMARQRNGKAEKFEKSDFWIFFRPMVRWAKARPTSCDMHATRGETA